MNNPSHLIEEDDIEIRNKMTLQSSDSDLGYYSSTLAINLYELPNGSYTIVFELHWPYDDFDSYTVSLDGRSILESIHDLFNDKFNNYSRLTMQFTKAANISSNPLYVDIEVKMKTGVSYPPKLQTYMVCYGVKEYQTYVPTNVYNSLWTISDLLLKDGSEPMEGNLNLGNNNITNLKDPGPTNSNYAATVNFVNKTISNNNSTMVTNYQK